MCREETIVNSILLCYVMLCYVMLCYVILYLLSQPRTMYFKVAKRVHRKSSHHAQKMVNVRCCTLARRIVLSIPQPIQLSKPCAAPLKLNNVCVSSVGIKRSTPWRFPFPARAFRRHSCPTESRAWGPPGALRVRRPSRAPKPRFAASVQGTLGPGRHRAP